MNLSKEYTAVVLAAGKGTRMKSPLPKVLHPVAGKPIIFYIISNLKKLGITDIRVVLGGSSEELIKKVLEPFGLGFYTQVKQIGTANAVMSADPESFKNNVIILNGDHPLINEKDLKSVIDETIEKKLDWAVVSAEVSNPGSLGRIVRHHGNLKAIVEVTDASAETKKIKEVNAGIYLGGVNYLKKILPRIKNHNSQKEFYITDTVSIGIELGARLEAIKSNKRVAFGVNTQKELAKATKYVFNKKIIQLMEEGVLVIDPKNTYIEPDVKIGSGTVIYPGAFIRGNTIIGKCCVIESNVFIFNSEIKDTVQLRAGSYLEQAIIEAAAVVGPYARIRPKSIIGPGSKIGNFVEMKNVQTGVGVKASHLAYLGDCEVGDNTNIGCGVITCNFLPDGTKQKTKIGKNVFVGSDTQFIAPLDVGDGAIIGSGSTITKNVPAGSLAFARSKQLVKEGYAKKYNKQVSDIDEKPSISNSEKKTEGKASKVLSGQGTN